MFIIVVFLAITVVFFSLTVYRSIAPARREEREAIDRMSAEAEKRRQRQATCW